MRVASWCWDERGRRLRIAGDLGDGAARILAAQAAARQVPVSVSAGAAALSDGARARLRKYLPQPLPPVRAAAHELRDALGILRLRMQLIASTAGPPALRDALGDIDRVVAAGDELIAAAGQPA